VRVLRGETGRDKLVAVDGVSAAAARGRLEP
jgi:multisubunit Na+/H+ antiporter MnhF subunit